MARKIDVTKINLEIVDVIPFVNDRHEGFLIEWDSDIGFGEYTIYRTPGSYEWHADSECMDSPDDREFITELMRLFISQLVFK